MHAWLLPDGTAVMCSSRGSQHMLLLRSSTTSTSVASSDDALYYVVSQLMLSIAPTAVCSRVPSRCTASSSAKTHDTLTRQTHQHQLDKSLGTYGFYKKAARGRLFSACSAFSLSAGRIKFRAYSRRDDLAWGYASKSLRAPG